MGLFVDTVSTDVPIPELGIILVHPTTNYDLEGKFDAREIRDAVSLTTAITGGPLRWRAHNGFRGSRARPSSALSYGSVADAQRRDLAAGGGKHRAPCRRHRG